jgi:predicted transcriptional regulator
MRKKKETTPAEVANAIALREAGYSHLVIAQKLNLSIRTVQRHLSFHGIVKGSLKVEVIDKAKAEMINLISSSPVIREEAAKLVLDDIAHSNHLRSIILEASEHLKATDVKEAVLVMRAAAAYSTALKNTSDTIRKSLGPDKALDEVQELPELIVRELTATEVMSIVEANLVDDDIDNAEN